MSDSHKLLVTTYLCQQIDKPQHHNYNRLNTQSEVDSLKDLKNRNNRCDSNNENAD